jgi:hypothetical protein
VRVGENVTANATPGENTRCAPPDPVKSIRTQFCVFPRTPETGQDALASSSLGVSRELHLALFPPGQSRPRARVAKLKHNYENENYENKQQN